MIEKPAQCPSCGKRFVGNNEQRQHAKSKKHKALPRDTTNDEPSMAELMIEAQMNRAMGIHNEGWIEDMLP